jgi:hypothetical protein
MGCGPWISKKASVLGRSILAGEHDQISHSGSLKGASLREEGALPKRAIFMQVRKKKMPGKPPRLGYQDVVM